MSEGPTLHIVTGAAGFIGSNLTDRLLEGGGRVLGIDCFRNYYPASVKRANIEAAARNPRFELLEVDLSTGDLEILTRRIEREPRISLFHLAARPGVRDSWGGDFESYAFDNIIATQRLLEWAVGRGGIDSFVFASSSSVYGNASVLPLSEIRSIPRPYSPYGVTKLAAENLVRLYGENRGLPTMSLRFFSVFGPRQRPDMAIHRFLKAALEGRPVEVFGSGEQTRDFTFVTDVVEGMLAAARTPDGGIYNLGGGHHASVNEVLAAAAGAIGREITTIRSGARPGDVADTQADMSLVGKRLGWKPRTTFEDGIRLQAEWLRAAREP